MSQTFVLHKGDANRDTVLRNAHGFLDRLPDTQSFEIRVQRYVKTRTDPQNHALFGVAYPALEAATGYTKDELHDAFNRRFFGTVEREIMGEIVSKPRRTTTTDEAGRRDVIGREAFSDFYAMVQQVGAEASIDVPDPDPWRGGNHG